MYRAQDELLGVPIAIKVLKPEFATHPEALDRFRHEILLSRDLGHGKILRTYDLGSWSGRIYLTMHWVDGPTLRRLIREQAPLAAERVALIGTRLAQIILRCLEKRSEDRYSRAIDLERALGEVELRQPG